MPYHLKEYRSSELAALLHDNGFSVRRAFGRSRHTYCEPERARQAIQYHCQPLVEG
uniref:Uncharacterized protein n=1 Tax=Candidatus Kentrum sp. DK TaxID=2126562 RepID=A0A450T658_9GAMM|nr:MAG: hypothetical protein BECKDK2373B_GA0170837_110913 [Candidatus Kentron sp. DK]